jgi:pyrimidine-specific ribonucleoside hydrolase
MSLMERPVILDVDTGIDDALTILYAAAAPSLALRAVTGVSGNVALDQVMINSARVLDLAEAGDVTLAAGAGLTRRGNGPRRTHSHGVNGLGDVSLPESARTLHPEGAVDLVREQVIQSPTPPTIAALAPQTNLADLIVTWPEVIGQIERIVFVGGTLEPDEEAEFNVGHDPEAAEIVLGSGVPLTMYAIDVFEQISVPTVDLERLTASDRASARLAGQLLRVRRAQLIGDAGALVLLTHPELFEVEQRGLRIGLDGDERGRTLADPEGHRIDVVTRAEVGRVVDVFVRTLLGPD